MRDVEQLKTQWKNRKMKAKKELAIEKRERRQTGGGKMVPQTSAQTQRIAAIILSLNL
jgi:hypothetical protein